jgi:hypothetical protein
LIKPVASVKKLLVTLTLAQDLPVYAVGDEKRLMQTILNVVGNAVKFSREGSISITAFVAKSESLRDSRAQDFFLVPSDNHFYLRVQVRFFNILLKSFSLRMLSCFMLKASCVHLPFLFNYRWKIQDQELAPRICLSSLRNSRKLNHKQLQILVAADLALQFVRGNC